MTDAGKAQAQSAPSDGIWIPALKEAGAAFVAAALLLAIFYVFTFRWIHPEFVPSMDREAIKLIAPGRDLIPVSVGGFRVEGSTAIVENFNGDEAILALPRAIQAEDYPFIKVNLQGLTRYSKFKILWRRAEDLSQTHALEFNRSGDEVTQIAMVYGDENYRGRIADIALLFHDGPALGFKNNNDVDITVHSIEFRPFSAWRVAEQILEDWTNPPLWSGSSNNAVRGIHGNGMVPPNLVAVILVGLAMLKSYIFRQRNRKSNQRYRSKQLLLTTQLCVIVYGWCFIELLRLGWRADQLEDSFARYVGVPAEKRAQNSDFLCGRYKEDCGKHLSPFL